MMNFYLIIMMIMFFMTFMFMNHPLAMGLNLLIQSLLISLFLGLQLSNFWFSYILFLVFIGGLMVLFIYVTSLASNEMFSFKFNNLLLPLLFMLFCLITIFFLCDYWYYPLNTLMSHLSAFNLSSISHKIYKIYSFPFSLLTSFLIFYLLLTLIAVVNITKFLSGALRSFN